MFYSSQKKYYVMLGLLVMALLVGQNARAYVMSSSNYRMQSDSVNIGGTEDSVSTNYGIRDTMGEIATGQISSTNYVMNSGYRQMDDVSISISIESDVTLSPSIDGLVGGLATGDEVWTIVTDSPAGYTLSIESITNPAMQSGSDSFADYTESVSDTPDYDWGIGSANSEFGYSPYNSSSQADKFKNNGSSCNTGSGVTDGKCWYGFSTTGEIIASSGGSTGPNGEETKVNFRAEVNTSDGFQEEGIYSASIQLTAVSN